MESPNIVEWILTNIDAQNYYRIKFPDWNGDFNSNVICPFAKKHKKGIDERPSFSVNIQKKGGCFCHACGKKIASIIHFEKETSQLADDDAAAALIYHQMIRPVVASTEEIEAFLKESKTSLAGAPKVYKALQTDVQIEPSTIQRFNLGFFPNEFRISIPILDEFGQLVNIRRYQLPSMRNGKAYPKILNLDGFGKNAMLFPLPELLSLCRTKHKPPKIYWFTGERDTILAWDRGIPSFCFTTGENVCKKEWTKQLKAFDAEIVIVEDNDQAGRDGAKKRLELLASNKIEHSLVSFQDFDGVKDFSDFIQQGNDVESFLQLNGNEKQEDKEEKKDEEDIEIFEIPKIINPVALEDVGEFPVSCIGRSPELLNRPIRTKAIVSGKMDRTYSVPYLFLVGDKIYRLPISRELLLLIREHDIGIIKHVQKWLGTKNSVTVVGHLTVTEVEIIPMIQPGVESIYTNQRCYFIGEGIEANKPYMMRIIPTSDMSTQETIGIIVSIVPVSNILDSYKFDTRSIKLLCDEFQPTEDGLIVDNLRFLAHEISVRWTGILNRDDLHLVALLTWLCPLQFEFPFEGIQRGWLNVLVLGDTETGKSKVCQQITKLFHCGVFINAESCSYVGLVGGAVKSSSGMFILRWGKIPLYNRQLVVVEELSGLTTQEISYMSEIRSAGVARYDKAGLTGETSAKTRLICLSNVRGEGKALSDYPTGVQAALGLIGQNEDLARFDLTLTATDDEVSGATINKDRSLQEEKKFTEKELSAFQELAMFAWSLKPDQIDFTISAYRACLIQTMKMSGEYHPSIPIFKAGSGRMKIARIAIAIACIQFAWCDITQKLTIMDRHVDAAAEILRTLYDKPSFGYKRYSTIQYNLQKVNDEAGLLAKLEEIFKEKQNDFLTYVSHAAAFTKQDISEALGVNWMFVERMLSQMYLSNLIKKGQLQREWTLSVAGRKWIDRKLQAKSKI